PFSRAARDRRARSKNFDAALFPAIASGPVEVDRNMTTFRGRAGAPVEDFSVEHDARADAGADCCEEHIAESAARSPEVFGETGGVGVIIHFDVHGIVFGYFVGKRKIAPARNVRRIDDYSCARVQRAGRTYTDTSNFRA